MAAVCLRDFGTGPMHGYRLRSAQLFLRLGWDRWDRWKGWGPMSDVMDIQQCCSQ
jgi:hypothetical protein